MPLLNSPLSIGSRIVRNRLVMPPMVVFKEKARDWRPDEAHREHYTRRARAGTGLVVVEATAVSPEGRLAPFQLRAWDDEHLPALAGLAEAIKAHGATALIQLHHAGANTRPECLDGAVPISPSGIPVRTERGPSPRAATADEISALIAGFAAAARRCRAAGFDGVEIHGAHGYLLSQFLSPAFNRRRDAWGGPRLADRLALPLAVVEAVREAIGPDSLLGYRLGVAEYIPGGLSLEEGLAAARALADTNCLDVISVSHGAGGGDWPEPPSGFGFSLLIWLASEVKKAVKLPVIGVGGIGTGREAQAALDAGVADAIAVGRAMLADPDWAAKALAGKDEEIRLCQKCRRCAHFLPRRACPAQTGHGPHPSGP